MPIRIAKIELSPSDIERFRAKVDQRGPDECWPSRGAVHPGGYVRFGVGGVQRTSSRVAWIIANGRQPTGEVCHTCDNRICCNPAHLYDGNHADNMRDMVLRQRHPFKKITHCPRGHPYEGDNLWISKSNRPRRTCRECNRARCREAYQRRRERQPA